MLWIKVQGDCRGTFHQDSMSRVEFPWFHNPPMAISRLALKKSNDVGAA